MSVVHRRLAQELSARDGAPSAAGTHRWPWSRPRPGDTVLADALEAMARALRAGGSLASALDECGGPCGLDQAARAARHGLPLADAIDGWAHASADEGAALAAAALTLGAEIGGGAARSLDAVADTLRERRALRREVHALSTQARASAIVIAFAPLAFLFVVSAADPSSAAFLVTTTAGLACLAAGLGLDLVGAWWIRAVVRRATVDRDPVASGRAEVVDLFALAVGAGLNLHLALRAVASRAPPAWAPALEEAVAASDRGAPIGDALEGITEALGDGSRPLTRVLAGADRYGTPLLPALERLAGDARLDRRRRAEEAARRVPVKLLFPLVLCVLPAFGLLTVAPLIAGALDALRL